MEHKKHHENGEHKIYNEHSEHKIGHHTKKEGKPNNKFVVMAVLLGLLIVVSGFQAIELVGLKSKISSELPSLGTSTGKAVNSNAGTSGGSLKNNLDSLPSMVGGC